jgi:predicted RNase H-like nuclease
MAAMTADTWVAGIDGCRAGWVVVLRPLARPRDSQVRLVQHVSEVLELPEMPAIIAIDIPIGLPDTSGAGGRQCDIEARKLLGARKSSVFSVPARAAVAETDYIRACEIAERHSDPPRKISKQTFNLFPKMREVDAWMTPSLQDRVRECHPEVVFWRLNGKRPVALPKKPAGGQVLRKNLLLAAGYAEAVLASNPFPKSSASDDDIIDAFACATAAADMVAGRAIQFPESPPCDCCGLRMEIWG